jgi:alcohol dehydrogenase
MKAAVLKAFGSPLTIETVPDPVLGTGEVIVDVMATRVLAYMNEVLSGQRKYLLDLPVIPGPGGIGRVRALGPDATHLAIGDWVYCDPTVRSRDNAFSPDITLQGLSAGGEGGLRLQKYFRDGAWAQQMRLPTENAIAIGDLDKADAARWCALGTLLVPYGGFLAAGLQPGETVVVNGATGAFGSAAVAVALGMGAASVIATGRSAAALADLSRRFGGRLRTVTMHGDEDADRKRILEASPGPIDCVLDILPPAASSVQVRTALMAVRPYGRVVLMGGVGMLGGAGLDLPYPWIMRNCITIHGKWMYPTEATTLMVGLIRGGLINLDHFDVTAFGLEQLPEAITHAAAHSGPFKMTVIEP